MVSSLRMMVLMFFLEIVVVYLDAEDDGATYTGDQIGQEE